MNTECENSSNIYMEMATNQDKEQERISDVRFDMAVQDSKWIKTMRMHYTRCGKKLDWDMAVEHDNVAVVIYHTEKKQLLLVKQFRPPVFIHTVRTRSENIGKTLDMIEWQNYPLELGETIELCAGLMDKPGKSSLEHIQEEILEECGYLVPTEKIQSVKRYVTGIAISGAAQHLFYAEIDDSMKVAEGGGVQDEGEYIRTVFLDVNKIKALLNVDNIVAPPSMLFALSWWIMEQEERSRKNDDTDNRT